MGARPHVNVVILVKWSRHECSDQVDGAVEVYVRDMAGNPIMRQRVVSEPLTSHYSNNIDTQ